MDKYFSFRWKHRPELASAFSIENTKLDHELIPELEGKTSMPFDFELKKVTEKKDGLKISAELAGLNETWLDYQPNSLAWPLMSEKLKTVIEMNLQGGEAIDWITCNIKGNNEYRTYYILRFTKKLDVLNRKDTRYVPGTSQILKPCFSTSKIANYNIFHDELPYDLWKITPFLYVSETLKKKIQKAKLTGIEFEKTLVA